MPSVRQSCVPFTGSVAWKKTEPAKGVQLIGYESPVPGQMSLVRCVPAVVPSVTQSSSPCVGSIPAKKIFPYATHQESGLLPVMPG